MSQQPKNKPHSILHMLADPAMPHDRRALLLRGLVNDPNPEAQAVVIGLLDGLSRALSESVTAEKAEELAALLQEMQEGPKRPASFVEMLPAGSLPSRLAYVLLDDGTAAYTAVPDENLASSLRLGDRVILEGKGRALLARSPAVYKTGEEVLFERVIDDYHVEVSLRGQERCVFLVTESLQQQIRLGAVRPGATLVANARQTLAFAALPPADCLSHFLYLRRVPPPNVVVDRDIGAPPACIAELSDLIRMEMTQPEVRRRYRLRRCVAKLLTGVSGSGKTLAIYAIWRRMYEIMSEVTGVPIDQLPPRVFCLRMSEVLSEWLGKSDKNLDRFFNEVEQLAAQPFVGPDGRRHHLPCLAVLEEIDGLARSRGQDPIYDRILTTALQRLDTTRAELADKLILFVGTTNEPQQVDRAFFRRIGGTVENFGRLKRRSFVAVLQKHLRDLPLASHNGHTPEQLLRRITAEITAWLYAPKGSDRGVVELAYAGSNAPEVKFRRDFLTGAMVDRAVQEAASEASQSDAATGRIDGLSAFALIRAFDQQIRAVVDQITERTAREYLDLPDGMRVAQVRRLAPADLPEPEVSLQPSKSV